MIIMKFGGTSVKDADAMKKVLRIVSSYEESKPLVVLSACAGMTDKLINLISNASSVPLSFSNKIIDEIENHHLTMINRLIKQKNLRKTAIEKVKFYTSDLRRLVEGVKLLKECTDRNTAQAESYGELLSTIVFNFACISNGKNSAFLDAREIIKTDSRYLSGRLDFEKVKENSVKIKNLFKKHSYVITQGFISSDSKGITTTLGRGGSDFSAAVFGAALKADEIQIWTDVSGVLTADPRLVKSAIPIPEISFSEMRELSFYGAKVLHPDTIKPAVEKKIPVRILNTYKPKDDGTIILEDIGTQKPEIHSVISKQNCIECKIEIPSIANAQKYYTERLNNFNKANYKILYSVCTEGNCRIIIDAPISRKKMIKEISDAEKISIIPVSVLCVSGTNLELIQLKAGNKSIISFPEKIISELSKLKVRQIIFGASPVSILLLTAPEDSLDTLRKIHSYILKNPD